MRGTETLISMYLLFQDNIACVLSLSVSVQGSKKDNISQLVAFSHISLLAMDATLKCLNTTPHCTILHCAMLFSLIEMYESFGVI